MEKIDRELLIKEISSRLLYGVKAQVFGWDEEKGEVKVPLRIYSINTDGYVYFETNDYDVNYLAVDACRLYLRPMSSMTDKELVEFLEIRGMNLNSEELKTFRDGQTAIVSTLPSYSRHIDWLNAHHFDYRGLIEKGLALEAPDGMYKMEE
jgi:hypothetical protein